MFASALRLAADAASLALAAPRAAAGQAARGAGVAARAAEEAAGLGARAALQGAHGAVSTAVRLGHVAANAAAGEGHRYWQAGSRLHLPLRPAPGRSARGVEAAARRVAAELAQRPDVITAYWDGGLARLVVELTQEAVADRVVDQAEQLAGRRRLERRDEDVLESGHPGHTGGVRSGAAALTCDAVGLAAVVAARATGLRSTPRLVAASAALLREEPRLRSALRARLGRPASELAFAAVTAAAEGVGRSLGGIALDAARRTVQLAEAVARAAAFDRVHDAVCAPDRLSVAGEQFGRPRLRPLPGEDYQESAVAGAALGAAGTLLFARDAGAAAEALRAGNPKASRYAPEAFAGVFGCALAREGVLVRNPDRLRRLPLVDTVVLHGSALRGTRRTVLEARPSSEEWSEERLWGAADVLLQDDDAEAELTIRPVPDGEPGASTGLMVAAVGEQVVGTVLVGWEPDPMAEPLLDAARRAKLGVLVVDDGSLGGLSALADRQIDPDDCVETVGELRREGHVVLTLARIDADAQPDARPEAGAGVLSDGYVPALSTKARADLAGLLSGDLAVALTDRHSAVVWGADALVLDGPTGAWRLIAAVPAARAAAAHGKVLAQAGAALSGLLVVTQGERSQRLRRPVRSRLSPVALATAAALLSGCRQALGAAARGAPDPRPQVPWHALGPQETVSRLEREEQEQHPGAAGPDAELHSVMDGARRAAVRIGASRTLAPARLTEHLVGAMRRELADPLTPVLVVGAIGTALLGSVLDALLVGGALSTNALVGAVQRVRVEHALAGLERDQRGTAHRVVADAAGTAGPAAEEPVPRTADVPAQRLHAGDVVVLGVGDVVPADARLLEAEGLEVDESSLTGESLPARKTVEATPGAPVPERSCMVHDGATVVAGHGTAVVVATGDGTEGGRAARLAARTPTAGGAQARLRELTRRTLPFTLLGGAAVTALALLRGRPPRQAVQGGLAVAVAAVPEGLPLVATVAQLAAARRLGRRGVLVRSARTLEALGRTDTVCFDKTGTLTENRLRVVRATGPDGTELPGDAAEAEELLRAAARTCPRADTSEGAVGHPHATDEAILDAAPDDPDWTAQKLRPFEAARGCALAVGSLRLGGPDDGSTQGADGERLVMVKGAPEVVLPNCAGPSEGVAEAVDRLAGEGLRVLAVARAGAAFPGAEPADDRLPEQMELLGLVGLADTPREGSARLVHALRESGVRPVVLTGDHPQTARAVTRQLGWETDPAVVTGDDLVHPDRAERARLLDGCDVVARVAPEQKLQVIEALREAGHVVAMVGDGANDAAAIRAADVGVAVATGGSQAARQAADLVLAEGGLAALVDAVGEGRRLWQSVSDAVAILVGGNAGEIGFSLLGTLLGGSAPLATRQILLVNLFTDMFPAMAVAVTPRAGDPPVGDPSAAPPPGPGGQDEDAARTEGPDQALLGEIARRGVATAVGGTAAWLIGSVTPGSVRRTATMALCGVVGAQLVQTVQRRHGSPLILGTALGSAAALAAIVETPGVSRFFGCTPLGPVAWAGVAAAVLLAAVCASS